MSAKQITLEIGLDSEDLAYYSQKHPQLTFVQHTEELARVTGTRQQLHQFIAGDYTVDGSEVTYIFKHQKV